jgi:rare lipoprotein A
MTRASLHALLLALACVSCVPTATYDTSGDRPPPPQPPAQVMHGRASYYADSFAGKLTASGERYEPDAMTAAHRTLPFGTRVRVVDIDSGRDVVVRINDRGPYVAGRAIDLSRRAARALGLRDQGVADVTIEVLASSAP